MNNLKNASILIAALGALATLGIMFYASSGPENVSDLLFVLGFAVWALLPYLALIFLARRVHRKEGSSAARVAVLVASVVVVVLSVLAYWISIFHSESSTSALVFVFIPFYALAGIAAVFLLTWLLMRSRASGASV